MVLKLRMVVLKMEIGPNYDDVPTRSQLLTDSHSSCICIILLYCDVDELMSADGGDVGELVF